MPKKNGFKGGTRRKIWCVKEGSPKKTAFKAAGERLDHQHSFI